MKVNLQFYYIPVCKATAHISSVKVRKLPPFNRSQLRCESQHIRGFEPLWFDSDDVEEMKLFYSFFYIRKCTVAYNNIYFSYYFILL